jgi:hypothetical protein
MTSSRAAADLLLERAAICGALFGMAADRPGRSDAAIRLCEIHSDPEVARILGKAMPPPEGAEWVPTPDEPGEPEVVRWPPDAA